MKIKEYMELKKTGFKVERKNFILVHIRDSMGTIDEYRVKLSYKKLSLGTGNLGEHRNPDFTVETQRIKNEKRRLGI